MATWIQSLSWALIYSVGQGLLIYAALRLLLKLLPAVPSNVKYHLSLGAMSILFAWFLGTWWQQYHILAVANDAALALHKQGAVYMLRAIDVHALETNTLYRSVLVLLSSVLPWLPFCYFIGLGVMVLRLSGGMMQLFSLKHTGIVKAGNELEEVMRSLKDSIQYSGAVQLLVSARAQVPMVIGFIKPAILLPAAAMTQLSTAQLETILLHELAHIKRYDYLINILQTLVETILFFNPFVWFISRIVRREREHCCDDMVVQHRPEPLNYATALAVLAENTRKISDLTIAASGRSNHLFNRIKRIMEMKKNSFSYSRMLAAILIIAIITCSAAWLSPTFAKPGKDKVATNKNATASKAQVPQPVDNSEEVKLVSVLSNDHLVDEINGFVVERQQDKLFINGKQLPAASAAKYLSGLKQDVLRIQVFSFAERCRQHPNNSFIQNLAPVSFSSGCVDYSSKKKPGC